MKPLAEVLRPNTLKEFIDQKHLVGDDGPISQSLKKGNTYSMVFWGPPGCGKTTLARIIANELGCNFIEISPTTAGVKDIKQSVANAKSTFFGDKTRTILFVDEIHRFNKAQQDYLLPHVENGTIILIGATTENPSFEIVSPLLSRTRVYKFNPIEKASIRVLIKRALKHLKKEGTPLELSKDSVEFLVNFSNGDARNVLNSLEILMLTGEETFDIEKIKRALQENLNRYDKTGEEHYNTISAYIKSMRAGDADAAVYYLARMIGSGEDPKFIARRMVVFASEDVGLANTNALIVANEVFKAVETIGYPECRINLAHGTVYLSECKKDRRAYDAIGRALGDVNEHGNLPIPLELRNSPTKLMKDMGYGEGYEMYPEGRSLLPKKLKNKKYFKKKTQKS
jgi:putative ATPase